MSITPIVPDKIWFNTKFMDSLGLKGGESFIYSQTFLDEKNFRINLLFGEDNSITSRDKIAVRILLNLIEELREGINVTRSEEELVEAKRMLKKFLPSELI